MKGEIAYFTQLWLTKINEQDCILIKWETQFENKHWHRVNLWGSEVNASHYFLQDAETRTDKYHLSHKNHEAWRKLDDTESS